MIRPTCDRETAAVSELGEMGGARMRKRCAHPDCKAALPVLPPVRALEVEGALPANPTHSVSAKPAPANGAPPSFAQIVAQSEARLLQVRERIAELRALETEERQLTLLLTAAGKPVKEDKPS